jgi:hypothetical protein
MSLSSKARVALKRALAGLALAPSYGAEIADAIDAVQSSPAFKARYAVIANVASLAAFTVLQDGVTGVQGDYVLLVNQTTPAQNGLYVIGVVTIGVAPLTRVPTMATGSTIVNGCRVEVSEGAIWAGSSWRAMSTGACVVGTNDPLFYPRNCRGILTLAAGTKTLGAAEGLFLFSATRSTVECTMNTPGGVTTLTVGGYGSNSASRVAGKSGTAAAVVIARVAAGTVDAANTSTVDWKVTNW